MTATRLHLVASLRRTAFLERGSQMTDGQLLQCFLDQRVEDAFAMLLRRHGRMMLGVCQRILKQNCDAEDAFQASCLVLLRKAPALRHRHTIGDWLHGVARHTALKARAAARQRQHKERQAAMAIEWPVEEILWQEWRPLLDREVERLPAKYRAVIVLCDLEQKSYREAAAILACSAGTVASRLSRARHLLAGRLRRYGVTLSVAALAALLTQCGTAAPVSLSLIAATMKAATCVAVNGTLTTGVVAPPVVTLTQGVLQSMFSTSLKRILALVAFLGIGLGAVIFPLLSPVAGQQDNATPHLATKTSGDGQPALETQLDQAIKALGGAEALDKFQALRTKGKVAMIVGYNKVEFNLAAAFQAFDRIRFELSDFKGVGEPTAGSLQTYVYNGAKIWHAFGKYSTELDGAGKERAESFGHLTYALRLAQMVTPLKSKAFKLAPVAEIKINDRPATGIRISHKSHPDVTLFFDKLDGLPVKCELHIKGYVGMIDLYKESTFELSLSHYTKTDGIKHFTKAVARADGKWIMDVDLSEITPQAKLDAALFNRP